MSMGIVKTTIEVFCSWCSKFISSGQAEASGNQGTMVSHGICPECYETLCAQIGEDKDG